MRCRLVYNKNCLKTWNRLMLVYICLNERKSFKYCLVKIPMLVNLSVAECIKQEVACLIPGAGKLDLG